MRHCSDATDNSRPTRHRVVHSVCQHPHRQSRLARNRPTLHRPQQLLDTGPRSAVLDASDTLPERDRRAVPHVTRDRTGPGTRRIGKHRERHCRRDAHLHAVTHGRTDKVPPADSISAGGATLARCRWPPGSYSIPPTGNVLLAAWLPGLPPTAAQASRLIRPEGGGPRCRSRYARPLRRGPRVSSHPRRPKSYRVVFRAHG